MQRDDIHELMEEGSSRVVSPSASLEESTSTPIQWVDPRSLPVVPGTPQNRQTRFGDNVDTPVNERTQWNTLRR